jgi:hypothetical protein
MFFRNDSCSENFCAWQKKADRVHRPIFVHHREKIPPAARKISAHGEKRAARVHRPFLRIMSAVKKRRKPKRKHRRKHPNATHPVASIKKEIA